MNTLVTLLIAATTTPAQYVDSLERAPELSLAEAIDLAVSENFDIRIARERLARSALLSKKAYSVVLPTVNANFNFVRNNQEIQVDFLEGFGPIFDAVGQDRPPANPATIQNLVQQNGALTFNWTLLSGRSLPLILNAYDAVDQSVLEYEQQSETLKYATSLAYYNALTAMRTVQIRTRAVDIAKRNAELATAQAELGSASSVDQLRAEVEVATAEQDLVQAQITKLLADRSLAVLINRIDERGQIETFQVVRPPTPLTKEGDLIDEALEKRFDLQLRELDLSIADRLVDESYTKFLPEVVAAGAINYTDAAGFAGNNYTWFLSLGLQWELFSGGQTFWELLERRHDIESAEIALEQQRVVIADNVEQSRLNLANTESNYEAARRRLDLARRSAELAQAQFEVGASTQLEVLDANRSLADAEASEALGELAVDLARIELDRVVLIDPNATASGNMAPTNAPSATDALTSSVTAEAP